MDTFIFDLYNTLIDIRTDEHREETWRPVVEFFAERGLSADWKQLCSMYDDQWAEQLKERAAQKIYAYPEGDMSQVFKAVAAKLGGEWSDETCDEASKCMRRASVVWLRLFPGTLELLARLRALGAKLYLLSNAQAAITYDEIEECGLMNRFDGMLISSECGCRKPDVKYFKMLFDKYGLDKRSAVMVGDDRKNDGKGAKAFGIKFMLAEGGAACVGAKLLKLAQSK